MADQDPIVKLDPGGRASILSHNVPESVSYSGRNYINLEFDGDIFLGSASASPSGRVPLERLRTLQSNEVAVALRSADPAIFPHIGSPSPTAAALFATQSAVLESGGALNTSTTSLLSRVLVSRCGVNFKEHLL